MASSSKRYWGKQSIKDAPIDHPDANIKGGVFVNDNAIVRSNPADNLNRYLGRRYSTDQGVRESGMAPGGMILNPLFLPTYLSGLQIWKSSPRTQYQDGAVTSQELDFSGNGRHLSSPTLSQSPIYRLGAINGVHSTDFRTSRKLEVTFTTVPQPLTMFCVVWAPTNPTNSDILDSFNTARCSLHCGSDGGIGGPIQMDAGINVATLFNLETKPHILCAVFNGASSFCRMDGVQSANVNPGANSLTNGLKISRTFSDSGAIPGFIPEAGIYNRALSTSEFQQLERLYLGPTYNIPVA